MLETDLASARADPRRRFGPYVLLTELGRGGMGVVFRAWDEPADRLVALKLLPDADLEAARRFAREAEAMAAVGPGVVPVHASGVHAGRRFIAMALLEGGSLAARLRATGGRALSLRARVAIVRDVARAVHAAHERGVIHRDLKPENVLLDADDRPYVADFGLARFVDGRSRLTATGAVVGTPAYMPPEQIEGSGVDARSDVYGLGATLFFALTGRPPFEGPAPINVMTAVIRDDAPPPSSFAADVPPALDAIVLRCLEKSPGARFASAAVLAQALDAFLAGDATLPRRPRRRRAARAVAALGAAAALALVAATLPWTSPAPPPAPPAPPAPPRPSTPPTVVTDPEPRPSTAAAVTDLELVSESAPIAGLEEVAFSPDGAFIVAAARDGSLRAWSSRDLASPAWVEREPKPAPAENEVKVVAFSPDGRRVIAAGNRYDVVLRELDTGRLVTRNADPRLDVVWDLLVTPDSAIHAVAADVRRYEPEALYELDPDTLEVRGTPIPIRASAIQRVERLALVQAEPLTLLGVAPPRQPSSIFVFGPDQGVTAFALLDGASLEGAALRLTTPLLLDEPRRVVVPVRQACSLLVWDLEGAPGRPDRHDATGPGLWSAAALGRRTLVVGSGPREHDRKGLLTLWEVVDERTIRYAGAVAAHQGDVFHVDAVGDEVVSGGADGIVRLWRAQRR